MKKTIQKRKIQSFAIAMLLLISAQARIAVCAQEEQKQSREVIVVMDCSKSMEDVDSQYLVYDFVRGLAASLPMN